MGDCPFKPHLSAYHDGELEPGRRELTEEHLLTCASCREELDSLNELSRLFASQAPNGATDDELARIRRGAQRLVGRPGRFAWGLVAAAASILIVAGAWLSDAPSPGRPGAEVTISAAPEWERVAMTLRVEPTNRQEGL